MSVLGVAALSMACAQWTVNGSNIYYNSGNVGIGTTSPTNRLSVISVSGAAAIFGEHTATSGTTYGVWGQTLSTAGVGVYGFARAGSGSARGVFGRSDSTAGTGVYGWASATSGSTTGVYGWVDSTAGTGVFGNAAATTGTTYGVWGQVSSPTGVGVYGFARASSGSARGVFGRTSSTAGTGVFGWASATSGSTTGVCGWVESTAGTGVLGNAAATTGTTYGVRGQADSPAGTGVYGLARASSGTNYGVYGATNSPDGFGVYAHGDMGASGLKSFRVDHPLRPETHYLYHYCTEAPEPLNAYSGVATLDAHGEAWVQLPDYFEAVNRDPRYTLTPIGAPMPNLHVAVEIQGNRFKIAGGAPNQRVSWRVEAIRNDPYVRQRGFQAEREKPREHQGKYLHPELYGQPRERAIHPLLTESSAQPNPR